MLVIRWLDRSKDYNDLLPEEWFAMEGRFADRTHLVRGPERREHKAMCNVEVRGTVAELDYRPFSEYNLRQGNILGVLRLSFADSHRRTVPTVQWKGMDESRFLPGLAEVDYEPADVAADVREPARAMSRGKKWSHADLLVAMNLYCKLPFGRLHSTTPEIVAVARLMGRTPASLSMKLCNFASMDPALQARGIRGLQNLSRADREIWQEFHEDWAELGLESEELYEELVGASDPMADESAASRRPKRRFVMPCRFPVGDTETDTSVKARRGQAFFRKAVLASYNCQCCITENPVPELLNASHIKPWRGFPTERLNPRNGLCLAKTYDSAFDAGLISFDEKNRLLVSERLRAYLPDKVVEREFVALVGRPLRLPEKFQPEPAFLEFHREQIFERRAQ